LDWIYVCQSGQQRVFKLLHALWCEIPAEKNGFANNFIQAISTSDPKEGYRPDLLRWFEGRIAELLRDWQPHSTTATDAAGHFAFRGLADDWQGSLDLPRTHWLLPIAGIMPLRSPGISSQGCRRSGRSPLPTRSWARSTGRAASSDGCIFSLYSDTGRMEFVLSEKNYKSRVSQAEVNRIVQSLRRVAAPPSTNRTPARIN